MQRWEYRAISRQFEGTYWTVELDEEFAELGRQGWELVTTYPVEELIRSIGPAEQFVYVHRCHFVFKRPYSDDSQ